MIQLLSILYHVENIERKRRAVKTQDCEEISWKLHILMVSYFQMELATGRFPYPKWNSVFDQLTQVVQGPAPQISTSEGRFSDDFVHFLNTW